MRKLTVAQIKKTRLLKKRAITRKNSLEGLSGQLFSNSNALNFDLSAKTAYILNGVHIPIMDFSRVSPV